MISSFLGILVFMPMEISSEVMWCAKQPDNVHVSYCFAKEKECKSFSMLKRKSKGSAEGNFTCRPKKIQFSIFFMYFVVKAKIETTDINIKLKNNHPVSK